MMAPMLVTPYGATAPTGAAPGGFIMPYPGYPPQGEAFYSQMMPAMHTAASNEESMPQGAQPHKAT